MGIVRDSDSHYLDTLATSVPHSIELPEKTGRAVLKMLSGT